MPAGLNSEFLSRDVLETLGFARLGEDVLIHGTAVIVDCHKISLGSRVRIDPYVIISTRGGVEFGNNVHLSGHSVLAGHAAIHFDDFVNISHHVGIYTSNEDISGRTLSNPTVTGFGAARTASISFGRHSGVGAGSLVLPGARFAEGSILGAMSRVSRPSKPWTNYAGIPARQMRERRRDALEREQEYLASLKKPG
ncbi:MAG: acyltransferase [Methylocella sp.]